MLKNNFSKFFCHWNPAYTRSLIVSLAVLMTCFFGLTHKALASTYSSGAYNTCSYTGQCPSAIVPVALPNGLKVIINLSNGQSIPSNRYTITITQLSGSPNVSLKSATISIDGKQMQEITPDSTGTARWDWDTRALPGTHVSIVITASDGTTSTYSYTIQLVSAVIQPSSRPADIGQGIETAANRSNVSGMFAFLSGVVPEGVKQVFRTLPATIINTFPYFLFVILGLLAAAGALQIKRELRAIRTAGEAVEQEQTMIELKKNFIGLASHYLRTPLTLVMGSIDLLSSMKSTPAGTLEQLKAASKQLSEHVEAIITDNRLPSVSDPETPPPTHGGVGIGISVAILAVAAAAASFNLLAYASGRSLPALNLMTQAATFVFVGTALYQIDRRFRLRRLERKVQDNVLLLQRQLQEGQDIFIERTATQLFEDYKTIRDLAAPLPPDASTKLLNEGTQRLSVLITECQTAQSLKGSRSKQQPVTVDIKTIFDHTDTALSEAIATKKLQLIEPDNIRLSIQEPALLRYVARSLIDNAVAYSPENGTITLDGHDNGREVRLTVADTGKGIPEDHQRLLFQPLSKVEGYENFDHAGMGFSLYLDKLIMEYLGGSIDLQSEENQGTAVNLQLPVTFG